MDTPRSSESLQKNRDQSLRTNNDATSAIKRESGLALPLDLKYGCNARLGGEAVVLIRKYIEHAEAEMPTTIDTSVSTSFTTPSGTSPPAQLGETITVNNYVSESAGPKQSIPQLTITDELSANIPQADVVVDDGGSYNAGIITWTVGPFTGASKAGSVAFANYTAEITIPANYGQSDIVSIAELTVPPGDTNPANNESTSSIAVVCFCSGTSIQTAHGSVPVEALRVGDQVMTASGAQRPIRWLGHRTIDCHRHPRPKDVHPVRIAAHTFGDNRPARDLLLSPAHAICVDLLGEVLVPAGALVNGGKVQQVEVDEITYWHVELDSHDLIIAENLACESYLEMGNRGFFREAGIVDLVAGPDADLSERTHADFCRPFVTSGPLLDAIRMQLQERNPSVGLASRKTRSAAA